ncbi:uncharacterized protein ALTATR162_LOCUS10677 [Alternaria atra]|uniref:Uncharacterized protein n=1 Tax=Alternaria atra TaxID=119953 RepID=A0A8J2I507_9PLEO|nr:uncharacterized protein ALTATR162_LOCUS8069 [Alternaria atra]XP_043174250.1 uncharacterized protein ALTATR162_LOCUS10677 [Alternaria atra]CAG5175388.1 unnamed protein product [Alternaria atra]CAG5183631.1 unnamed protein product [Alternaria atra]
MPRSIGQTSRRTYAAEAPPPHPPSSPPNPNSAPPPKEPSRVGAYYGTFGSPLLKCFLGALFTYQLSYYLWYKLEAIEETHDTKAEIRDLQEELRQAIEKQRYMAQQKWGEATEALEREKAEFGQAVDAVTEDPSPEELARDKRLPRLACIPDALHERTDFGYLMQIQTPPHSSTDR